VTVAATAPRLRGETPDATSPLDAPPQSQTAEEIRLRLADAWGDMGAAWGVAPAIAHGAAHGA
jgi:hypothetical protein